MGDEYLEKMRIYFEGYTEPLGIDLRKSEIGSYIDPFTDWCFTFFSTGYQFHHERKN